MKPKYKAGDLVTNRALRNKSILFIVEYVEVSEDPYYDYPHYRYYQLEHPENVCMIGKHIIDRTFIKASISDES